MEYMKKITLEEVAKEFTEPEMFKEDLLELHVKFRSFLLKYGELGLEILQQAMDQEDK